MGSFRRYNKNSNNIVYNTPISIHKSNAGFHRKDAQLITDVNIHYGGLTSNEWKERSTIIQLLKKIISQWSQDYELLPFGSFVLGTSSKQSDIDLLLVSYDRNKIDFFDTFTKLIDSSQNINLESAVPNAFIPLIKIKVGVNNVDVDITFTELDPTIRIKNIDHHLLDIPQKTLTIINGYLVNQYILAIISNKSTFQVVLKYVRLWAKKCYIYSNIFGFLGGISWSILVARIIQLFPNCGPTEIIYRFFQYWANWKWPTPISLKYPETPPQINTLKCWTQFNFKETHTIIILTPRYPYMNSTHKVFSSTFRMIITNIQNYWKHIKNKKVVYISNVQPQWLPIHNKKHMCNNFIIIKFKDGDNTFTQFIVSKIHILIKLLESPILDLYPFNDLIKKNVYLIGYKFKKKGILVCNKEIEYFQLYFNMFTANILSKDQTYLNKSFAFIIKPRLYCQKHFF
jgi:poly(A) polymerase Pap1